MFLALLLPAAFAQDCPDFWDLEDPNNPCVDPAEGSLLEQPFEAVEVETKQTSGGVTAYINQPAPFGVLNTCGDWSNTQQNIIYFPTPTDPILVDGMPEVSCDYYDTEEYKTLGIEIWGDGWWYGCNWFASDSTVTLDEPETELTFTYAIKAGLTPFVSIEVTTVDGSVQTFTGPGTEFQTVSVALEAVSPIVQLKLLDQGAGLLFQEFCWDAPQVANGGLCQPVDADLLLDENTPLSGRRPFQRQCKPGPPSTVFSEYWPFFQETSSYFSSYNCANDECICDMLSINGKSPACERAEAFYATLLLNLAEGNVAPCNCVLGPQETVAGVVDFVDSILLGNPTDEECESASEAADAVNDALSIVECDSTSARLLQMN